MAAVCDDTSHSGTVWCYCKGTGVPGTLSGRGIRDAVCQGCNGDGYVCSECCKPKK